MSMQMVCDGCGKCLEAKIVGQLAGPLEQVAISGERMNGTNGNGLPDGRFDWCVTCAQTAFAAIRESRGHALGGCSGAGRV